MPFDLHVLGTPPAFVLSQDQTLLLIFAQIRPFRQSSIALRRYFSICYPLSTLNYSKQIVLFSDASFFPYLNYMNRLLLRVRFRKHAGIGWSVFSSFYSLFSVLTVQFSRCGSRKGECYCITSLFSTQVLFSREECPNLRATKNPHD